MLRKEIKCLKPFVVLFTLLLCSTSFSDEPFKIAVVDTGYFVNNNDLKLCDSYHKDFTGTGFEDTYPHGQVISHLISNKIVDKNACLVIVKWKDKSNDFEYSLKAFRYLLTIPNLKMVNFSGGGFGKRQEECDIVEKLQKNGTKVIMAAGNEDVNLTNNCNYFPACCNNRVIVVGNLNNNGTRHETSNYGTPVDYWERGVDVSAGGATITGTSPACAIRAGKELTFIKNNVKMGGK